MTMLVGKKNVKWCRGQGLFALEDFALNSIVFEEDALISIKSSLPKPFGDFDKFPCTHTIDRKYVDYHDLCALILSKKSLATILKQKLSGVDNYKLLDPHVQQQREYTEDKKLFDIVLCNSHWMNLIDEHPVLYGIWLKASKLNHHCIPNCGYVINGGRFRLIAIRKIRKDEELTINYLKFPCLTEKKDTNISHRFGFVCECSFCNNTMDKDMDAYANLMEQMFKQLKQTQSIWMEYLELGEKEKATREFDDLIMNVIRAVENLPEYYRCVIYYVILRSLRIFMQLSENLLDVSKTCSFVNKQFCKLTVSINFLSAMKQIECVILSEIMGGYNFKLKENPFRDFYSIPVIASIFVNSENIFFKGDKIVRFLYDQK